MTGTIEEYYYLVFLQSQVSPFSSLVLSILLDPFRIFSVVDLLQYCRSSRSVLTQGTLRIKSVINISNIVINVGQKILTTLLKIFIFRAPSEVLSFCKLNYGPITQ